MAPSCGCSTSRAPDGTLVVAGYFNYSGTESELTVPGLAALQGNDAHEADQFVLGIGSDGTPAWLTGLSSKHTDTALAVAALPGGGVVVSGYANDDSSLGAGTIVFSDGETVDVPILASTLISFDTDGARGWTRTIPNALGRAVGVGSSEIAQGTLYFSGVVFGEGEPNENTVASDGDFDGAISLMAPLE